MKIRSAIRAGDQATEQAGGGGCPEAQAYQQKAYNMMMKVYNCTPTNHTYVPSQTYVPVPSYTVPSTGSVPVVTGSYPDRSGWCG